MENAMNKDIKRILIVLFTVLLLSCENVFKNDKLDFLWRLDSVEYLDGYDLFGKPCEKESKEGYWFSFARDLVEIENNNNSLFSAIGILTENGNTLIFDFSMYNEESWSGIDYGLKIMGIDSKVSTFTITELNSKTLVLTGTKTILRFTKW